MKRSKVSLRLFEVAKETSDQIISLIEIVNIISDNSKNIDDLISKELSSNQI